MKLLKKMTLIVASILIGIIGLYILVLNFTPSFGGDVSKTQKQEFEKLGNFQKGKFRNRKAVPEKLTFSKFIDIGYKYFTTKVENGTPTRPPEIAAINPAELTHFKETRLFWFGHSAFLLQHVGKNILIDPMLGNVPAPISWLGGKRFNETLPIAPDELPKIDYVVLSHDHYDHLDYETIMTIKDKVNLFLTPLGLGNHLIRWGVQKEKIIELNWWDSHSFDEIEFVCTPAQHFSGRKFSNGQETLWSSWVIQSDSLSLFFSGDSGYDIHFKEIGEKYGPFDVSLLECGQYNKMWPDVHMFPKETVQAGVDLNAKKIIPIHWGSFKLALHPWNEPAIEALEEATKRNVSIEIPKIGKAIEIDSSKVATEEWWY